MEVGNIVEAQFNGAWYPCVIESKTGDNLSVEFLGYKNKETLNIAEARLVSQEPSINPESINEGKSKYGCMVTTTCIHAVGILIFSISLSQLMCVFRT